MFALYDVVNIIEGIKNDFSELQAALAPIETSWFDCLYESIRLNISRNAKS